MNKNAMYEGYHNTVIEHLGNTRYVKSITYIDTDNKAADYKIIVCPNTVICNTVVNVIVESYNKEYVCTYSGVSARDGWHISPSYGKRWCKKPYHTEVMSIESFNKVYGDITLHEID